MRTANTFWKRFSGVMFRWSFEPIWFPDTTAIHTCWVRRPIHLCWINSQNRVIKIQKNARTFGFYFCSKAHGVIEYPQEFAIPYQIGEQVMLPKNTKRNWFKNNDGQALVEFALILPVLLLLIFGFLYLSTGITQLQRLQYVVNSAASTGAITNQDLKVTGVIEEFYPENNVIVTIESLESQSQNVIDSNSRRYNDILTVQLQHDFPITIPYIEITSIPLRVVATSRILCQEKNYPYTCQ